MTTLSDVTLAHSQRLSAITQRRERRLREAMSARDQRLRLLPGATKIFHDFERAVADAGDKRRIAEAKAAAARVGALQESGDVHSSAVAKADRAQREADLAAFEQRRLAEAAAEHEFILAIGGQPAQPTSTEAQKVRAQKLERARTEFESAQAKARRDFEAARDAAMDAAGKASNDAARTFDVAVKVSTATMQAELTSAEQALHHALAALPDGAAAFDEWRVQTAAIMADYKREEDEEFARFRAERQAVTP